MVAPHAGAPCASADFELDAAIDLAWLLAGDERAAARLLDAALRARAASRGGEPPHHVELLRVVARTYLREARRPTSWVRGLLRRGRRGQPSIEGALLGLDPVRRVCVLLRERLGLPVAEIAEVTGLAREDVRDALFLAREQLRAALIVEKSEE